MLAQRAVNADRKKPPKPEAIVPNVSIQGFLSSSEVQLAALQEA